jgi:hypothetical protein
LWKELEAIVGFLEKSQQKTPFGKKPAKNSFWKKASKKLLLEKTSKTLLEKTSKTLLEKASITSFPRHCLTKSMSSSRNST